MDNENISNEWNEQDKEIIKQIREKSVDWTWKTFKQLFDDANTENEIITIQNIFNKIKKEFPQIHDLLRSIEKQILKKKNEIVLDTIFSELWDITEELWWDADLMTLITIKEKLKTIQKKRKNIAAWVIDKDKELKQLLEIVNQKIKDYHESHKEEIEQEIEENLNKIKEILDNIENTIDISSIYEKEIYKATEGLISNLDTNLQNI